MKKKFFKALSACTIVIVLALNVTVVLDDNATSYLKFDMIGQLLAGGYSGSSSYSAPSTYAQIVCIYTEDDVDENGHVNTASHYPICSGTGSLYCVHICND